MSTAEYERLGEIRQELEHISNVMTALYIIAVVAAAYALYKASGVSVQWLTS